MYKLQILKDEPPDEPISPKFTQALPAWPNVVSIGAKPAPESSGGGNGSVPANGAPSRLFKLHQAVRRCDVT